MGPHRVIPTNKPTAKVTAVPFFIAFGLLVLVWFTFANATLPQPRARVEHYRRTAAMVRRQHLLAGGFALYLLVAFLREFGYLLFGIAVIGGFILTITTGSEKEKIETRKTIVKTVIGLGIAIIIAFVVVLKPDFTANIFQPGANVRNAYLTQYSETVTVEDAFDNFFDNRKWGTYKENDYSYVTFIGACEYLGERADVKITFKITGENFLVERLDVNGTTQNDLMLYGLLTKVYEDY